MPCIRVGHAGRMLLSSRHPLVVAIAVCTGFVQHVTAARQVQPGLFDRLDTSQQIHRCLLICLASRRSCRSDAAVLCHLPVVVFIAVCTGFVPRQVQPGLLTDLTHPNRCTDVYWYALNLVQVASPMQLSAAICRLLCCCSMHRVCATCQHRRLQAARSASPIQHIKTIVLGNSSVLLSSYCADAVYGLFCSEYCCMHRVCLT
jgi:hypothetical protein